MSEDQVIQVPSTEASFESPEPTIRITDYPFDILLDVAPTDESLELIYGECLSNFPEIESAEAEILAKTVLWGARPLISFAGLKLRWTGVDGKNCKSTNSGYFSIGSQNRIN